MQEFHETPTRGHAGVNKAVSQLQANIFRQGMRTEKKVFVDAYKFCQETKYTSSVEGLLQALIPPTAIWEDIAMDFITNLP